MARRLLAVYTVCFCLRVELEEGWERLQNEGISKLIASLDSGLSRSTRPCVLQIPRRASLRVPTVAWPALACSFTNKEFSGIYHVLYHMCTQVRSRASLRLFPAAHCAPFLSAAQPSEPLRGALQAPRDGAHTASRPPLRAPVHRILLLSSSSQTIKEYLRSRALPELKGKRVSEGEEGGVPLVLRAA